ncbi:hypothetical protein DVR12_25440 [Chitinophaga silvatica]|uniref:Two component regulator propeller n=1 Tax=Chitinophaga silvatica TaxID=2282649 RepID=A0A3E1Y2Q3_9BACT|nr:sensor histidine kinase [Chitinophaga silvatica]RFS18955.1 hypothetical protein DVR12_25440 [Chitinophaga silvatica]
MLFSSFQIMRYSQHIRTKILLVVMVLITCTAHAQLAGDLDYNFSHIDLNKGLASNHVSAILQDKKGFVWVATTALQRYDGSNFVTVASFDRIPGSIYYDDICLCEDRKGRIWMGTPDNIRVYDPVTNQVKALIVANRAFRPEGLQCTQIVEDHNGIIWATSHDGLLKLNERAGIFEKADIIPESARSVMLDAIMEDDNGDLWLSGKDGLFILDRDRKHLYSRQNNPKNNPVFNIINTNFKKIYKDPYNRIWLAARDGNLYAFDAAQNKMSSYQFRVPEEKRGDAVFDIIADNSKDIWIATERGGIYRYNRPSDKFDLNIANSNEPQGLHYSYEVNCFMCDREGHLWVGTDKGINILSLHNKNFKFLDHKSVFSNNKEKLPSGEVTGIYQASNGEVYIGYWGQGLSRLSNNLELLNTYNHLAANPDISIPEERSLVWSFGELKDGTILIGQENGNLSLLNPQTGKFIKHLSAPELYQQTLLHIQPYNDTVVYIGLYKRGLSSWNPKTETFRHYPEITDSLKRPVSIMDIVPEKDTVLWLGTSSAGLLKFNTHLRKITDRICFQWNGNIYNNITSLLRYNDSLLIAGTDHGLWIYNLLSNISKPLLINNQLFDQWVLSIASGNEDLLGTVWMTTQYGFYRYDIDSNRLETFVQNDDIIDNNRKVRRNIIHLQNGNILVGAADHVVAFNPATLRVSPPPPDVTIINLKALDSAILFQSSLKGNASVVLSYKQNFITIEFKSLQYHQEKLRYYYQLEGVDDNWVMAENLLIAKYTNLPPGRYTFKVKAVNTAGTFSNNISTLSLFIQPAFWQTNWFRIGCLLIALALFYLYYKLRVYSIRKEAKQREAIQQQIAQLEMKALRAQMNPHFIFNALNSIQIFVMKHDSEQALSYMSRFAKLIRNILDHSQLNNITIHEEANMLENYMELEKLRFSDGFDYEIIIDPELNANVEVPTMIIQPFVENAIWHGLLHDKKRGKLIISFTKVEDRILCVIEDNGVGREKAIAMKQGKSRHQSRGLQITRDRLSLYNSRFKVDASFDIEDLTDEEGKASGTRVNIWFPLVEL